MASKQHCQRAVEIHGDDLASRPNVIGLGIVPAREAETPSDFAIAVYVERKVPLTELAEDERVPTQIEVPGRGSSTHSIRTHVLEQGAPSLEPGL